MVYKCYTPSCLRDFPTSAGLKNHQRLCNKKFTQLLAARQSVTAPSTPSSEPQRTNTRRPSPHASGEFSSDMAGAGDGNILPLDADEPILDRSNIVVSETQPTTCNPPETDDEVRAMNMVSAFLLNNWPNTSTFDAVAIRDDSLQGIGMPCHPSHQPLSHPTRSGMCQHRFLRLQSHLLCPLKISASISLSMTQCPTHMVSTVATRLESRPSTLCIQLPMKFTILPPLKPRKHHKNDSGHPFQIVAWIPRQSKNHLVPSRMRPSCD